MVLDKRDRYTTVTSASQVLQRACQGSKIILLRALEELTGRKSMSKFSEGQHAKNCFPISTHTAATENVESIWTPGIWGPRANDDPNGTRRRRDADQGSAET